VAYTPPIRSEMQAVISRSLRDVDGNVFGPDVLNDFINEGLGDMSLYRPVEATVTHHFDPVDGLAGLIPAAIGIKDVYMVEVGLTDPALNTGNMVLGANSPNESLTRTGWEFAGGGFRLPVYVYNRIVEVNNQYVDNGGVDIIFWGYRDRDLPLADDDVLDLQDVIDQFCLVSYCKMAGYVLLEADRGLYQQWLAATNNTDTSPTQLQGMRSQAESTYDRLRGRSRIIRRTPVLGYQYVS